MNIEEQRKAAAEIAQEIGARVDEAIDAARNPLSLLIEHYRGERERLRDNVERLIDYAAASAETSNARDTPFREGMAVAYRDMHAKLIVAKYADFKEASG